MHPFINSETKDNTCTLKNRNEWKKTFSENYIKPLLSTKCHLLSKHEFSIKQQRPLKTTLWVRIDFNRQILRFKSINIKTPTQYAYLHIQECLTNTSLLLAKPVSFLNINDFKWTLVYKKRSYRYHNYRHKFFKAASAIYDKDEKLSIHFCNIV